MREALERLGAALLRPARPANVPEAEIEDFLARALVVIPAGGFGTRMQAAGAGGARQKALLPLPNGETLISRLLRQYRAAGCHRFLALVNYEGQAVAEHLAALREPDAEIHWSFDPSPEGAGRAGALRHAMAQGLVAPEEPLIVHNADCQIIGHPGSLPRDLARAHLAAAREGEVVATLVAVTGTPYPFTGMRIDAGRVVEVAMYPFVPLPTHAGVTLLAAEAQADFRITAGQSWQENFEATLFPRWAAAGRLAATLIAYEHWVAVDEAKSYRRLCDYVAQAEGGPPARRKS